MKFAERNSGDARYNFRARIISAGLLFAVFFVAVIGKAVYLMVIKGPEYREMARKQHTKVVTLSPKRGSILDRNRKVIAESVLMDSFYAHPNLVTDKKRWAAALAPILKMDEASVSKILDADKNFIWVKRFIGPTEAETLTKIVEEEHALAAKEKRSPGLVMIAEYSRFYPQGRLAAQLIGFTGGDEGGGLEGLESKFDTLLKGAELTLMLDRDGKNNSLFQDPGAVPISFGGENLVTTLDVRVQAIVEEALDEVMKNHTPGTATAAVMEVKTGRILAMASRPTYNPNDFRGYPKETYRNRFVSDIFEPGSTFKTFTFAAALDSKQLDSDDEIFCEDGAFEIDGSIINDTSPHGWFTVEEIIVHSSNIGAAKIGLKLGRERLGEYIAKFGFGAPVATDFPGESKGIVWPMKKISRVGVANVAFGHGLAVTSLQLLAAINAIANGGEYVTPTIVESVENWDGPSTPAPAGKRRRVMSPEAAAEEIRVLTNVVHGGGTGARAAPKGYTVGGKTGTAQKVNTQSGGYYEDKYVASFIGFAPSNNPVISIIVVVDDPVGEPWGGTVAAPAFKLIAERALPLLGVPAETTDEQLAKLIKSEQNLAATTEPVEAATPEAQIAHCATCMPDLMGLSLREVMKMAIEWNIRLDIAGNGKVVSQAPRPGMALAGNDQWWVRLSPDPF